MPAKKRLVLSGYFYYTGFNRKSKKVLEEKNQIQPAPGVRNLQLLEDNYGTYSDGFQI